jgi:hypothetical protein
MELSVDIKYRIGTKEFTLYSTTRNATLTARGGQFTFGPFYYLGSLVKSLGAEDEMVRVDRDTVRRLDVAVKARIELHDRTVETEVITSTNNLDPVYPITDGSIACLGRLKPLTTQRTKCTG